MSLHLGNEQQTITRDLRGIVQDMDLDDAHQGVTGESVDHLVEPILGEELVLALSKRFAERISPFAGVEQPTAMDPLVRDVSARAAAAASSWSRASVLQSYARNAILLCYDIEK